MSKVNHPGYYGGKDNPYEAIKIIEALGLGEGFTLGNCIKYITRAGDKNPDEEIQDLDKAIWYLKRYREERIEARKHEKELTLKSKSKKAVKGYLKRKLKQRISHERNNTN